MADQQDISYNITAKDNTGPGFKSVKKGAGDLAKDNAGKMKEADKAIAKSSKGILSTFTQIQKGTEATFGGGGGGVISRMSSFASVTETAGISLAEAAESGGLLAATLGPVGVGAAIVTAAIAGVAIATDKMVTGWAKGVVGAANLASIIGVSTKALQEFQGAAERAGVDSNTAGGAMAGLSQTLNDARYGRNTSALEVLRRLGVGMKLNGDGTVDTAAMLPTISDALKRQNSSGARTAAGALGIPLAALPALMQGGAALSADMADVGRHGNVQTPAEIRAARRWYRSRTQLGQMAERGYNEHVVAPLGRAGQGVLDAAVQAGNDLTDGRGISLPAVAIRQGAETFARAVDRFSGAIAGSLHAGEASLSGTAGEMASKARSFFEGKGWTRAQASGIAANILAESQFNPHAIGDSGLAYGLGQWHPDRQANFRQLFGHDMRRGTLGEQLEFYNWELAHTRKGAGNRLRRAGSASEAGAIVSRYDEGPRAVEFEASRRGTLAEGIDAIPVKVEVTVNQHGKVTAVKTTAGRSSKPAISHAMPY